MPVAHNLDEADELPLICGQLGVLWCDGPTVEGDGSAVLMQNNAEPCVGSVAVDDEGVVEVEQLQCRSLHQGLLEGDEGLFRLRAPRESRLLEQLREWVSHQTVVLDELTIVAREAKKASQRLHCGGAWPRLDGLHLGRVHGHHAVGDDVAEVVDGGGAEGSLALLHG
jgi:hypothetical protein